ncbi:hypothetical protein DSLASN_49390 [Desulfoluna limicola]|uniref:Uncharacterized protein n=1 Tax=Desulfoluna limicola TaxID=2810562 RepID=A0ABM7PPF4_9BACT|nr:hypothetical protein DSLASN_49390 [Desulfoluna limicola]
MQVSAPAPFPPMWDRSSPPNWSKEKEVHSLPGPAGSHTNKKFDTQATTAASNNFAKELTPSNKKRVHSHPGLQGIIPWPPGATLCPTVTESTNTFRSLER